MQNFAEKEGFLKKQSFVVYFLYCVLFPSFENLSKILILIKNILSKIYTMKNSSLYLKNFKILINF